jgi:hypothetical protein
MVIPVALSSAGWIQLDQSKISSREFLLRGDKRNSDRFFSQGGAVFLTCAAGLVLKMAPPMAAPVSRTLPAPPCPVNKTSGIQGALSFPAPFPELCDYAQPRNFLNGV